MTGVQVGYSHRGDGRHPVEIAVQLPKAMLSMSAKTAVDAGAGKYASW